MIRDTFIQGIPCQARVTYFFEQKPLGPGADSDYDCYGYTVVDFDVLDTRGRPAPWLERKMTDADRAAIERQIIAAIKHEIVAIHEDLAEGGAY